MMELTKERLQEIAEDGFLKHGEAKAMARQLLAGMEQEPVAYMVGDYSLLHYQDPRVDEYLGMATPLYAAPQLPQPAVPDELAGKSFEYIANKFQVSMSEAQWILVGWNACRAAMLQGAEPVSQPYTLPDGYCVMPKKLTAENGAKGALSGEFHVTHRITCQSCGGEGCEDCNEEGGWDGEIPIGWDTIKLIYGAAVESCALPVAPQQEA
ncbi:hypothetical protein [Citrobacter braakii]|uniref:hypothetical protein n=1 Tax=Citrobacter braakii TaxID=57706 RepID=UPI001C7E1684|nr:hypothetical protein [Citrobacter braakii]